jgi:hypothetical protein
VLTDPDRDEDDETKSHAAGKYSRDPRLSGIRKKYHRWEVRVTGGKDGKWNYVGLAATLEEAIQLRDQARQQLGRPIGRNQPKELRPV